ncbi:MAG: hypothetical protein PHP42_04655 [Bacteroidota bacterium]|nr:hypothetical protein [Bacteroidota bacterium]
MDASPEGIPLERTLVAKPSLRDMTNIPQLATEMFFFLKYLSIEKLA